MTPHPDPLPKGEGIYVTLPLPEGQGIYVTTPLPWERAGPVCRRHMGG